MLGYVAIVHIKFKKMFYILIEGKKGLQRKNCSRQNSMKCDTAPSQTLRSITLRGVRIGAV